MYVLSFSINMRDENIWNMQTANVLVTITAIIILKCNFDELLPFPCSITFLTFKNCMTTPSREKKYLLER